MKLEKMHNNAQLFKQILSLKTDILAIKMIKNGSDIPKGAIRPKKDGLNRIDLCQAFAMSRFEGKTVAMLKEDNCCFEPVLGFGLAEHVKEFYDGITRYPWSIAKKEDAKKWVKNFPHLKFGEYIGIVTSSLMTCDFIPDIFTIYCSPEQLTQLLITQNCLNGEDVTCTLSGHAGCVFATVPVLNEKKCMVSSPCRGDRNYGRTQNDEIIYSCPIEQLEKYLETFDYLQKHGWGFPLLREMKLGHTLNNNYKEIGEKIGMKYDD